MDEDFYDTLRAQVLELLLLPITFAKSGGEILHFTQVGNWIV